MTWSKNRPARRLNRYYQWTPEAIERLRQMAGTMQALEIAGALGCTVAAVRSKMHGLHLKGWRHSSNKTPSIPKERRAYRKWTPERISTLRTLTGTVPARRIAAELGLTIGAVYTKMHALGLRGWKSQPGAPVAPTPKSRFMRTSVLDSRSIERMMELARKVARWL